MSSSSREEPNHLCADGSLPVLTATVEELVGNLCDQIEAAEAKAERWAQELIQTRKRANEAERSLAAAIDALRPFSAIGGGIGASWDGERRVNTLSVEPLRAHHLRRAVALVAAFDAAHAANADSAGRAPRPPVIEDDNPGRNK